MILLKMEKATLLFIFTFMILGITADPPQDNMVALYDKCHNEPKLKCVGVLMSETSIVTAAHCVNKLEKWCLEARKPETSGGDEPEKQTDLEARKEGTSGGGSEEKPTVLKVTGINIHPFYDNYDYDIAVLKIEKLDDVQKIELPTSEPAANTQVDVVGFKEEMEFPILTGTVIDREMCKKLHDGLQIRKRFICILSSLNSNIGGGYPVFLEKSDSDTEYSDPETTTAKPSGTKYNLIGIAMKSLQPPLTILFTNTHNSEISSFIKNHI